MKFYMFAVYLLINVSNVYAKSSLNCELYTYNSDGQLRINRIEFKADQEPLTFLVRYARIRLVHHPAEYRDVIFFELSFPDQYGAPNTRTHFDEFDDSKTLILEANSLSAQAYCQKVSD